MRSVCFLMAVFAAVGHSGFVSYGNRYCTSFGSHQVHATGNLASCQLFCTGSCNAIALSATSCNTYVNCVMGVATQTWGYTFYQKPPVDCVANSWGSWGSCSKTCGGGTQSRTRSIARMPANGGSACPALTSTQTCNAASCSIEPFLGNCYPIAPAAGTNAFSDCSRCPDTLVNMGSLDQRDGATEVDHALVYWDKRLQWSPDPTRYAYGVDSATGCGEPALSYSTVTDSDHT